MPPRDSAKAELLAKILRGPSFVRFVPQESRYHVGLVDAAQPANGVWLSLTPDPRHSVMDYRTAVLRLDGRELRLARRDADRIARIAARALRRRALPMRWPSDRRGARRKTRRAVTSHDAGNRTVLPGRGRRETH